MCQNWSLILSVFPNQKHQTEMDTFLSANVLLTVEETVVVNKTLCSWCRTSVYYGWWMAIDIHAAGVWHKARGAHWLQGVSFDCSTSQWSLCSELLLNHIWIHAALAAQQANLYQIWVGTVRLICKYKCELLHEEWVFKKTIKNSYHIGFIPWAQ